MLTFDGSVPVTSIRKLTSAVDGVYMMLPFDIIAQDPEGLRKAVRDADREMAARAGNRSAAPVYLAGRVSDKSRPAIYHALKIGPFQSEITGATVTRFTAEKDDLETRVHDQIETTSEAQMPLGYPIPAAWRDLADLLALHGSRWSGRRSRSSRSSRPTASATRSSPLRRLRAT